MQDIIHSMTRKFNAETLRVCDQLTKDIANGIPHESYTPPSAQVLYELSHPYEDLIKELHRYNNNNNNNNQSNRNDNANHHANNRNNNNNTNNTNSNTNNNNNYYQTHSIHTRMSARLRGEKVPDFSEMENLLESVTHHHRTNSSSSRVEQRDEEAEKEKRRAWRRRRRSLLFQRQTSTDSLDGESETRTNEGIHE